MAQVKFKKLTGTAVIPFYSTEGAVGMDLSSIDNVIIPANSSKSVSTGLACQLEAGYEMRIRGRSGLAFKSSIEAFNGTIDVDFRGEIRVLLFNRGSTDYEVKVGDRIAQAIVSYAPQVTIVQSNDLEDTDRGTGGFGSTGI